MGKSIGFAQIFKLEIICSHPCIVTPNQNIRLSEKSSPQTTLEIGGSHFIDESPFSK